MTSLLNYWSHPEGVIIFVEDLSFLITFIGSPSCICLSSVGMFWFEFKCPRWSDCPLSHFPRSKNSNMSAIYVARLVEVETEDFFVPHRCELVLPCFLLVIQCRGKWMVLREGKFWHRGQRAPRTGLFNVQQTGLHNSSQYDYLPQQILLWNQTTL